MSFEIRGMLFGKKIADRLISKNKGKQMIFTGHGIGDVCVELAYAAEYKKTHGIEHLAVITHNKNHALYTYFGQGVGGYDSLIELSYNDINALLKFYKSDYGLVYRRKHPEILCAYCTAYVRSDFIVGNTYIRLSDIEKAIYHIPKDTQPCRINKIDQKEWIQQLIKKEKIIEGKTVLLNPYADSVKGVPMGLFEVLADELKKMGFKAVTGVHDGQLPVPGTEGIDFPLEKTISLAEACGYVIGARSGFLDLCSFADAKIIAVEHDSYILLDFYRLEDLWPQNKNIKSFIYKENIEKGILDYIREN
jgi:hypothetical protein